MSGELLGSSGGTLASVGWRVTGDPQIQFRAIGPAGISIDGVGRNVHVSETNGIVIVTIPLDDLQTGIWFRDRAMKVDYLETAKFPVATFGVKKSSLRLPEPDPVNAVASGQLTLHGITRTVRFGYHAKGAERAATVEGSMQIDLIEFEIDIPRHLGVSVRPIIEVLVKLDIVAE